MSTMTDPEIPRRGFLGLLTYGLPALAAVFGGRKVTPVLRRDVDFEEVEMPRDVCRCGDYDMLGCNHLTVHQPVFNSDVLSPEIEFHSPMNCRKGK